MTKSREDKICSTALRCSSSSERFDLLIIGRERFVLVHLMLRQPDDVQFTLQDFAGGDFPLKLFVTDIITFPGSRFNFRQ